MYQNSTETGIILIFLGFTALQHKKNVNQRTVNQRIFNATRDWEYFNVAQRKNEGLKIKEMWTTN